MPQQPLVSIIVPIYNAQKHIARCVESIRRQTYQNLEILLLNDGSQDVSLQVCQMYAGVDKRIVLIDKANSGVAATRNLGLQFAKGEYLQFVDADDTILPNATELLVDRARRYDADLVIAPYNRITPPRPRSEEAQARRPRPTRPDKVQTFGFLLEGPMSKEQFATGLMQEPASFYYGVMKQAVPGGHRACPRGRGLCRGTGLVRGPVLQPELHPLCGKVLCPVHPHLQLL